MILPNTSASVALPQRHWVRSEPRAGLLDWREGLRAQALHVWLNFSGEGMAVWPSGTCVALRPGSMAWVQSGAQVPAAAHRMPGPQAHECLCLTFPNDWLAALLAGVRDELSGELAALALPTDESVRVAERPLASSDQAWAQGFLGPHLCEEARLLLDQSRLTEFLLRHLFATEGAGAAVSRTQRLARERVERVKRLLRERLDEPPSLESLAAAAGCSAPYLSRTFTEVEGRTLSLWLRGERIRRAADLLRSGRCNVSEAAVEVGYRSLSHFSRAFQEEMGAPPSRWLGR